MSDTIFGKIVSGEIPSEFIYEDEHCVAINDINPQAPVHVLVIPKRGIPRLVDAEPTDQELLGHLMLAAGIVLLILVIARGYLMFFTDTVPINGLMVLTLVIALFAALILCTRAVTTTPTQKK